MTTISKVVGRNTQIGHEKRPPLLNSGDKLSRSQGSHNCSPQKGAIFRIAAAKKGFVLLPRRWVVERSFGWMARFRRRARDYERLPDTLYGLHFLAFAILMTHRSVQCMAFCL
jgi:transposase